MVTSLSQGNFVSGLRHGHMTPCKSKFYKAEGRQNKKDFDICRSLSNNLRHF